METTSKRPGRPRKDDMIFWGVRLDQATVKAIREAARLSGATQGDIIRDAVLSKLTTQKP